MRSFDNCTKLDKFNLIYIVIQLMGIGESQNIIIQVKYNNLW